MSTIDQGDLLARFSGETEGGNYFVSNYPPFSAWSEGALESPPRAMTLSGSPEAALGVYVHVPFCRKRCHFCYFKVYTDKGNAEVEAYIDAVIAEAALMAAMPITQGRRVSFLYIGGGTPSYLSARQLRRLIEGLGALVDLSALDEFTLECEPGTVSKSKLAVLSELGVTRLSLGVESLDDEILEINGRAHRLRHVDKVWQIAKESGIPQLNLDLISGLVGEREETWQSGVKRLMGMDADSVTIYQMEMPRNTTFFKARGRGELMADALPDWPTKRRWSQVAFSALEAQGYQLTSAVTAVRDAARSRFVYRDSLWGGADMVGLGVSSFGHVAGTHYQNEKHITRYVDRLGAGELPIQRGYVMSADERLTREAVLLLKRGSLDLARLERRYGVDPQERFKVALEAIVEADFARLEGRVLSLSRDALLQVDRLLPAFFADEHLPVAQ